MDHEAIVLSQEKFPPTSASARPASQENTGQLGFSIIIPTFRRPVELAKCLKAISEMDYPVEFLDVIVVDDGGGCARTAIASLDLPIAVSVLEQENRGPAAARNAGAGKATKSYLAFLDDDCEPDRDWLSRLSAQFALAPDCMAGGRTVNRLGYNSHATASQLLVEYLYQYYGAADGRAPFFTSNNLALPAARFHELCGFDDRFREAAGEDRDLGWRWRERGWQMVYCPDAIVAHAHRMSWRGFWRQHYNYGRAAFQFHQGRALAGQRSLRVEPPVFYLKLLLYPFKSSECSRRLRLSMLLLVSQVANALGFFSRLTQAKCAGRRRRTP